MQVGYNFLLLIPEKLDFIVSDAIRILYRNNMSDLSVDAPEYMLWSYELQEWLKNLLGQLKAYFDDARPTP